MPVRRRDQETHKPSTWFLQTKVTPEERLLAYALAAVRKLNMSEYLRALISEDEARVRASGKRLPKR
jgi:hypothetical protein